MKTLSPAGIEQITKYLYDDRGFSREPMTDEPLYYPVIALLYQQGPFLPFKDFLSRFVFPDGPYCMIEQIICQECARAADDPATDPALLYAHVQDVLQRYMDVRLREVIEPATQRDAWPRRFCIRSIEVKVGLQSGLPRTPTGSVWRTGPQSGQIRITLKSLHDGLPRETMCHVVRQCERGQLLKHAVYKVLFERIPRFINSFFKTRDAFRMAAAHLEEAMARAAVGAESVQFVHRVYSRVVDVGAVKKPYPIYICVGMFHDNRRVIPAVANSSTHPLEAEAEAMTLLARKIDLADCFTNRDALVPCVVHNPALVKPAHCEIWHDTLQTRGDERVHLTVALFCYRNRWAVHATVYRETWIEKTEPDKYRAAKARCVEQLKEDMRWRVENAILRRPQKAAQKSVESEDELSG